MTRRVRRASALYPYAGTSGWTSTDTSRDRALHADSTGLTRDRHIKTMALLEAADAYGRTCYEVEDQQGRVPAWHHGVVSGAFTRGRRIGDICMLKEMRGRGRGKKAHVHVHRDYVNGREVIPYRHQSLKKALHELQALLELGEVQEALQYIAEMLAPPLAVVPPPRRRRRVIRPRP